MNGSIRCRLHVCVIVYRIAAVWPPLSLPAKSQLFCPTAMVRSARSDGLLSMFKKPCSVKRRSAGHCGWSPPWGGVMLTLLPGGRILVAVEPVDGRKGIDSLAGVVRSVLQGDPLSGDLFVFKNNIGD